MALNFEAKKLIVEEMTEVAGGASAVIAAQYGGLNVSDMTELRQSARDAGVYLRVVKNTLARRALKDSDFACVGDNLSGQMVLAFSQHEHSSAARVVRDFSKKNDKLVIKLIAVEGRLLETSEVDRLADLPSKEGALSMLMGVMIAPVANLVRTLSAPSAKLLHTIKAVSEHKNMPEKHK